MSARTSGRGGGRERGGRHAQLRAEAAEPPVVRTKIVAPLADAVGFVHDEPHGADAPEQLPEAAGPEALGGDVHQVEPSRRQLGLDGGALVRCQARMQRCGGDSAGSKPVHLVLHERDQRRHDDRRALEQQRGKLEAERLAGARWASQPPGRGPRAPRARPPAVRDGRRAGRSARAGPARGRWTGTRRSGWGWTPAEIYPRQRSLAARIAAPRYRSARRHGREHDCARSTPAPTD